MKARYEGLCPKCGQTYPEGTQIMKIGAVWCHSECPEVVRPAEINRTVQDRGFRPADNREITWEEDEAGNVTRIIVTYRKEL